MNPLQVFVNACLPRMKQGLAIVLALQLLIGAPYSAFAYDHDRGGSPDLDTRTPIKHVIIIIGENRSFDHTFGTFVPRDGQTVLNLLSEGIIDQNGNPGPNFSRSAQFNTVVNGA